MFFGWDFLLCIKKYTQFSKIISKILACYYTNVYLSSIIKNKQDDNSRNKKIISNSNNSK